jgi:hypothetical protein
VVPVECAHEQDLLDAIAAGRWPARCDEALRQHVAECRVCGDLAEVAAPLKMAGDELWDTVHVPSSGTVWLRAQTRARREAAREAARPVTIAQGFGFAVALVGLVALTWLATPWLSRVGAALPELPSIDLGMVRAIELPDSIDLERWRWIGFALAGWLVLAPIAIYFALLED